MRLVFEKTIELIKSILGWVIQWYTISTATLLSIFVPQSCSDGTINDNRHECTEIDNITHLTVYNTFVIVFNFVTLGLFFGLYVLEIYRENLLIDKLSTDKTLPHDHLKIELVKYPIIKNKLISVHIKYLRYTVVLGVVSFFNSLVSGILVFKYFYLNKNTVIIWLTFSISVFKKIYDSYLIAMSSYLDLIPTSAFMTERVIFNKVNELTIPAPTATILL